MTVMRGKGIVIPGTLVFPADYQAVLRLLIPALLCCLFLTGPARAAEEALAYYDAKSGEVVLAKMENGDRAVLLNGKVIASGTANLTVYRFLKVKTHDALLLRDFTGPIAKPARFRFVVLDKEGAWMSPDIGHFTDAPQVSLLKDGRVIVEFGSFGPQPAETWVLSGRELKMLTE